MERMCGYETEFALSALNHHGQRVEHRHVLEAFSATARTLLPHLPDTQSAGIFLQNSSRFYIDSGGHPELALPEMVNPWDACRYAAAGDRLMHQVAQELLRSDRELAQIVLTRCNVCYARGAPTTWGCHESYCHRADTGRLAARLIPHLVSRVIYTGAGGFNNMAPGIDFMISPRVAHLARVTSSESTCQRGIFHTKDETLSRNGYHRLHVICGEAVSSERSLWLKMGATALVVAMIEAEIDDWGAIQPRSPLAAMQRVAGDPACRAPIETVDGRRTTALAMQRRLLERAEFHCDHPAMPPWSHQVCGEWRRILDLLEEGAAGVVTELDWAIKLGLFQELARQQGVEWESLAQWHASSPLPPEVARLRSQLFELDTRFSQVSGGGIFAAMDAAGVLRHHVQGVDNIEHAMVHPPAGGRARLRGEWIRRLHGQRDSCCDWMGVWDGGSLRYLDLSDPFAGEERWERSPPDVDPPWWRWLGPRMHPERGRRTDPEFVRQQLTSAAAFYDRGEYEQADRALRHIDPSPLGPSLRRDWLRLKTWNQARRGCLDGLSYLSELAAEHGQPIWLVFDHLTTYRFRGLAPHEETAVWIERGLRYLREHPEEERAGNVLPLHEHRGAFLLGQGRPQEAVAVLSDDCLTRPLTQVHARIFCRAKAVLGEAQRRLGRSDEAARWLDDAASAQRQHQFLGDLIDLTHTSQAKLQADRDRAGEMLREIESAQSRRQNRMAMARTLLLRARFSQHETEAEEIRATLLLLRSEVPALGQCRLLASILRRWTKWTDGRLKPDRSGDVFWGV